MAQANRTNRKRSASPRRGLSHGFGMLVIGMVTGSLATILWQGMRIGDNGTGSGIRKVVEQSLQQSREEDQETAGARIDKTDKPVEQQTRFDFFTVLPEIEMVVPDNQPPTPLPLSSSPPPSEAEDEKPDDSAIQVASEKNAYMLQAGSYQKKADADRLKVELALWGHASQIQKVTIEGRGDFYRVRIGPWFDYDEMVRADESLASFGIKALRLKISGGQ